SASLSTGDKITASEARRLACEAEIIPAVLNGKGEVLDLGRKQRFHSKAQRLAIGLEQQHCQHLGCDVPAAGCHVHHRERWTSGGHTNTRDAQLLCPRHHSLAHRPTPMRT
ncbi:MAG: HNH endonuclease signature motif containing protein, partial [Nocardioides sp.]